MEIPGYFFAFPIANRGGRWEHQPHQFWLPSSLLSSQSAPRAAAPPRVPTSPPAYKPQTSPTCCFAGKTPYSRSPKLATAGIPGRTPCRGAGCERGSGMGSPRQLPLPWRCLPVRLWPMASRPRPPPPSPAANFQTAWRVNCIYCWRESEDRVQGAWGWHRRLSTGAVGFGKLSMTDERGGMAGEEKGTSRGVRGCPTGRREPWFGVRTRMVAPWVVMLKTTMWAGVLFDLQNPNRRC